VVETLAGIRAKLDQAPLQVLYAQGSEAGAREQVGRLEKIRPRLVIILGTRTLMTAAPVMKRIPGVFALVANPYFTSVAYDPKHPEDHQDNLTGIATPAPVEAALAKGAKLLGVSTWGLLYDPNDGGAAELAAQFTKSADSLGLKTLVETSADAASDLEGLERLRSRGAKVIYLPPAVSAARYAALLLAWGREHRVLVVSSHPDFKDGGAVLWVGLDYYQLGEETGALARRVLAGENPGRIPIMEKTPLAEARVNEALLKSWAGYPAGR